MAFQKAHGLTIAQNGYIENMVCESLSSDPSVVEAGRLWFNETEKLFKFSTLDGGGGVIVRAIKAYCGACITINSTGLAKCYTIVCPGICSTAIIRCRCSASLIKTPVARRII